MKIDCPLCCGEKFSSQESLRYHLLSMTVNLYCPACNQLCDTIPQLVEHLGNECGKTENNVNIFNLKQEVVEIEQTATTNETNNSCDLDNNTAESTENNIELVNATTFNNDAMILEDGSIVIASEENSVNNNEANKTEEVYSCSSCGVNFTSIMDHIEQYHDGQEVIVEMADNMTGQSGEITDQTILIDDHLKNNDGILNASYFEDELDSSESEDVEMDMKYPQFLNTLKQEECVDKDGRVYTRKVVQIEKFWDDASAKNVVLNNEQPRRKPLCELYTMEEDGTLVKYDKNIADEQNSELDITDKKLVKLYSCPRCKTFFSELNKFDKHKCDPERASDYKCSRCDASFNNSKSLCAHMKAHKVTRTETAVAVAPFLCTKCDTVFPTNKSLRLHQRMHEPIKAKEIEAPVEYGITGPMEHDPHKPREMFVCPICKKSYDKSYETIHMATHSGVDDYDCDICNRKFYTSENLEMHNRVHNGGKPFSCSYCKNFFDSAQALTEHMDVHTKDRPYSCGYCGRKFARPHEKVKHERIHTGEKPHECEICGKTFRVSYCLTLHMRTHTGARPYVCKHCGKRFKAHSVYNHHLLTHSDERNYRCPYCPKAFKTGVQLAGHKNSHTKPFSCTECNRPFASLYAVRSHMESHKRENNLKFSCYLCGASYARNFALRDHIKEVHATNPVVLTAEDGGILINNDKVKLEEIEQFKASNSILNENDETEMALNQLREETTDDEL